MNLNLGTIFTIMRLQDEASGPMSVLARTVQTRSGELATNIEAVSVRLGNVNKLVKDFSGIPAMRAAEEMAAAVTKLGGASNLTAAEQAKVNGVVTAALDKYRALGQEAPKHLQDLANATKSTTSVTQAFNGVLGQFGLSIGTLTGAGALATAAGGLLKFGKDAAAAAGHLTDLSARTGVSVQDLQRLEIAGRQVGVGLDQAARAINTVQKNLGGDDEGAVRAVRDLGLNVDKLLALSPGQMFEEIGRAIAKIPDPAERTRVAIEVLGKAGAENLPLLLADIDKLAEGVTRMSDGAVESLDRAGDSWERFWLGVRNTAGEAAGWFFQHKDAIDEAFNIAARRRVWEREWMAYFDTIRGMSNAAKADLEQELAREVQVQVEGMVPGAEAAARALGLLPPALKSAAQATAEFDRVSGAAYKRLIDDLETVKKKTVFWNVELLEARLAMDRMAAWGDLSNQDNPFITWNHDITDFNAELRRVDKLFDDIWYDMQQLNAANPKIFWNHTTGSVKDLIAALEDLDEELAKLRKKQELQAQWLQFTADLFQDLATVSGKSMGVVMRSIGQVVTSVAALQTAMRAAQAAGVAFSGAMATSMATAAFSIYGVFTALNAADQAADQARFMEKVQAWTNKIQKLHDQIRALNGEPWDFASLRAGDFAIPRGDALAILEKQIRLLREAAFPWEAMQEAAEKYGISLDQLGSQFDQAKFLGPLREMVEHWRLLTEHGTDAGVVAMGMKDKLQAAVLEALKFGRTLPEGLKAAIQKLIEMGELVDENGNKMEDIERLTWVQTIEQSLMDLVAEFKNLVAILQGPVSDEFDAIGRRLRRAGEEGKKGWNWLRDLPGAGPGAGGGGAGGGDEGGGGGGAGPRGFNVLPFRLPESRASAGAGGMSVSVVINNPVVRSQGDIRELSEQVERAIMDKVQRHVRLR